jgi:hypothetical protein
VRVNNLRDTTNQHLWRRPEAGYHVDRRTGSLITYLLPAENDARYAPSVPVVEICTGALCTSLQFQPAAVSPPRNEERPFSWIDSTSPRSVTNEHTALSAVSHELTLPGDRLRLVPVKGSALL